MINSGRPHFVGDDCPGGHTEEPFACAGHGLLDCPTCARNVRDREDCR